MRRVRVVLDANVLLRAADPSAPLRPVAVAAVTALGRRGDIPVLVPQSLYEFWVVATRPREHNGLGLSVAECRGELAAFKAYCPLFPDLPGLYPAWEDIVAAHACRGKPAHDARYVAAMRTHGLAHLLTFNAADFARYPGVVALDPLALAA